MRPDPGLPAGGGDASPMTTDQMANCHVPLADQYPRRGAGRKGAYRRRHAMAPAPPLPPSPRRAQRPGQGNGAGAGSGLDTFRSLNTSRQYDTSTDNERLQPRKDQVITNIHEQPLLRPENPWVWGRRSFVRVVASATAGWHCRPLLATTVGFDSWHRRDSQRQLGTGQDARGTVLAVRRCSALFGGHIWVLNFGRCHWRGQGKPLVGNVAPLGWDSCWGLVARRNQAG
jgi:hypothetical protein